MNAIKKWTISIMNSREKNRDFFFIIFQIIFTEVLSIVHLNGIKKYKRKMEREIALRKKSFKIRSNEWKAWITWIVFDALFFSSLFLFSSSKQFIFIALQSVKLLEKFSHSIIHIQNGISWAPQVIPIQLNNKLTHPVLFRFFFFSKFQTKRWNRSVGRN